MIQVKTKGHNNQIFTQGLDSFAESKLDGGGYDSGGAVEQAARTASNNSRAIGRLLSLLLEKSIIEDKEVLHTLGIWPYEILNIAFVKEEE